MKMRDLLKDDVVILEISGKIMEYEASTLMRGKIHEFIDLNKRNFVLDLAKVPWMNTNGISMLLAARDAVKEAGGRLVLCGLTKKTLDVLVIMHLVSKFETFESREAALKSFAA